MTEATEFTAQSTRFELRRAATQDDILAAQRLRYRVFVEELGGDGPLVDHDAKLEIDKYDPFFDHLVLFDRQSDRPIIDSAVGVYRVMRSDQADLAGGFYSEDEYDLEVLKSSDRRLLELGRSCVHASHRGGTAVFHLWNGLARYIADHQIEVLFGVASFHGTNVKALAEPLSYLHHNHLAPETVRVKTRPEVFQTMDILAADAVDRKRALVELPSLIKAYLRLGGFVGEGAFVDRAFNTTDVSLVMDTARMNEKFRTFYSRDRKS